MVFIIITLRDIITRIESVDVPYIITSTIIIGSRTNITQYKSIMFNIVGWWRCGSSEPDDNMSNLSRLQGRIPEDIIDFYPKIFISTTE